MRSGRSAILVTSHPGQAPVSVLEKEAEAGLRPRKDYVELARLLDADVVDLAWMRERARPAAQAVARRAGTPAGQIAEAWLRRRDYAHVCAWADRLGLPLGLVNHATRAQMDLVLVSVYLTAPKKAALLRLGAHRGLRAILSPSTVQIEAARRMGVPAAKLPHTGQRADTRFWRPGGTAEPGLVCAVGWEARDYVTLAEAVRGTDIRAEVALGTVVFAAAEAGDDGAEAVERDGTVPGFASLRGTSGHRLQAQGLRLLERRGVPANVVFRRQLPPLELRRLYERASVVVVPLHDVDFDAGATAIAEAMAMGKPLIVTASRGQRDLLRHGEHGLTVPPYDAPALRAAITKLLDDPAEAARMGEASRAEAEARHHLDGYVARLAQLISAGPPR